MIWILFVSKNLKHLTIRYLLHSSHCPMTTIISGMLVRDQDMLVRPFFTKRNSDNFQVIISLNDMISFMMMVGLQKLLSTHSRSSTDIFPTDDRELMEQRCSVINSIFMIRSSDMYNLCNHKAFKPS